MRMYNLIFLLISSCSLNFGCSICEHQGLFNRGFVQSYNNERNHHDDQIQGLLNRGFGQSHNNERNYHDGLLNREFAQYYNNEGSNRDDQILRLLNRGYAQSHNNEGHNRDDQILALLSKELPRPPSKKTERTENINQLQRYLLSLEGSTESTSTEQFSTITTLFYG